MKRRGPIRSKKSKNLREKKLKLVKKQIGDSMRPSSAKKQNSSAKETKTIEQRILKEEEIKKCNKSKEKENTLEFQAGL